MGLAGVFLLEVGLSFVFIWINLSRQQDLLEDQIASENQVLQGLESLNPAFLMVKTFKPRPVLPLSVIHGWEKQMDSVLLSLPGLSFPWRLEDLRDLHRLERYYRTFFREASAPDISLHTRLTTIFKIMTARQRLLHNTEATDRSLRMHKRSLGIKLRLLEAGILAVGLLAFVLFSMSILSHRSTRALIQKLALSQSTLTALIEALPVAVFLKDAEGRWLTVNQAGLDLFELDGKNWQYRTDLELAHEIPFFREALETCRVRDLDVWKLGQPLRSLEQVPRRDGTLIFLETTKIPLKNPDGTPMGLLVSAYDLTEHMKYEEILGLHHRLFTATHEGIVITDETGQILEVNPAFSLITGYPPDEIIGKNLRFLQSGRHDKKFYQAMWECLLRDEYWEGEIWNRRKSGETYCEWLGISTIKKEDQPLRYIGIFSDITRVKEEENQIVYLAFHDALTGLANRRMFRQKIEEVLARSARELSLRFTVGILDLDGFKEVNDRLGHPAGDDLLVQVSRRLEKILRTTDILARLGGDEFGLLLLEPDEEGMTFDRIIQALVEPFPLAQEPVSISGSLGVTFFSSTEKPDADLLIAHADMALYRVKNQGGAGWTPFQPEMAERIAARHRIRSEFATALSRRELVLHYQPQVNMVSGAVIGVEALVRWIHPERGLLFPAAFIEEVEKSDLIVDLGRYVLDESLAQIEIWRQQKIDLHVSVNIGARHFLSETFMDDLKTALTCHFPNGVCPMTLELEVTETEALLDLSQALRIVEKCREIGIAVSLDDFGTGQASLTSLQMLPVGEIKIDQQFVRKIRNSAKDQAIVQILVVAGQMMEIAIVAEGIETEEDGLLLIGMGCFIAQGYAIARSMPAEAIPTWITEWRTFPSWKAVKSRDPKSVDFLD